MIAFVAFALVGSYFRPGASDGKNTNFRVLCYTLILVHFLLAFQYSVVFICCLRKKMMKLLPPLGLNILVYLASGIVFITIIPRFKEGKINTSDSIYSVWWIVLVLETLITVAISSIFRLLSFKKTHLMERMHLLTLIVIGFVMLYPFIIFPRIIANSQLARVLLVLPRPSHV
jgi:hypothetical protein